MTESPVFHLYSLIVRTDFPKKRNAPLTDSIKICTHKLLNIVRNDPAALDKYAFLNAVGQFFCEEIIDMAGTLGIDDDEFAPIIKAACKLDPPERELILKFFPLPQEDEQEPPVLNFKDSVIQEKIFSNIRTAFRKQKLIGGKVERLTAEQADSFKKASVHRLP